MIDFILTIMLGLSFLFWWAYYEYRDYYLDCPVHEMDRRLNDYLKRL